MRLLIILCCAAAASFSFLSSCHKSSDYPSPTAADYFNMKSGNYWIYETFVVDSTGNGSPGGDPFMPGPPLFDSIYVEKDTVIGSNTYYKLMQPVDPGYKNYQAVYLRDSSGYEVNSDGGIRFAAHDFATIFYTRDDTSRIASGDSDLHKELRMTDENYLKKTPAGIFRTSSWTEVTRQIPFVKDGSGRTRYIYSRYTAGIGMVSQTLPFYWSQTNYVERQLIRYHLN